MSTTFSTDHNNDLFLGNNRNISISTNLDGIIRACETATKAQLGEMILTTGQGIPNFQSIWVGSPNYSVFSVYLRNTLEAVPGVQAVTSLEVKTVNNTLQYRATIKTAFGAGEITSG